MSDERGPVRLTKDANGPRNGRLQRRTSTRTVAPDATRRLEALVRRAGLALLWERLWPRLWAPIAVVTVFLTLSWLGLWMEVSPTWRMVGAGLFALALLISLWPLARLALPRGRVARAEKLARLDRDSGLAHRPATTFEDTLAVGGDDPGSRALWALHRSRAEAAIGKLTVAAPSPGMAKRDRYALRAAAILVLVASAFVAGPDLERRITAAFDWRPPQVAAADWRIDGWIDPPLYTRRPPLMIDLVDGDEILRAPVGSTVVVRVAGRSDATIEAVGGLVPVEEEGAEPGLVAVADGETALVERRFTLTGDGELSVRTGLVGGGLLVLEAIPDAPPTIRFAAPPEADRRGAMTLAYAGEDDYGIASLEGEIARPPETNSGRTLVPPPDLGLAPPHGAPGTEVEETVDLTEHYWGGARVDLTLVARDDAGQEGRSETIRTTIPQRPFFDPLARALIEQRRNLVLAPDDVRRVQTALDALLIEPALYTPEWGVFLGMRATAARLRQATTDEELIGVADGLWELAILIEDGDLTEAQRRALEAAERLQDAIDQNAPQDEIDRLMAELREAMDRMLQELAEQMQRQMENEQSAEIPPDSDMQSMSRQDLDRMLEQLEQAMREGDMAEAQRLMNQLQDIMRNLQTARPDSRMTDPIAREMDRQMNELDRMMRDQSELRDETFREGQQGRQDQRRQQQGQQGQEGQEGQQGQQGQQGLAEEQQDLRERLQELQRRMRELGMQGEEGLEDAEQAMRDAEGALGEGDQGQAVEDQGRALEGLQRGMQGMAQQMQQMMGEGQGDQPGQPGQPGQRGRADAFSDDPLGRPTRGRDFSDGDVRVPEAGETAAERARRIMQELRDKLGDPTRPREELEYFERLLRPN